MADHVKDRKQFFRIAEQIECFIGKSGEGGKPAQNADNKKCPRGAGQNPVCFREIPQETDGQASGKVNRKRPNGESGTPGDGLGKPAKKIAQNRSQESARANQQQLHLASAGREFIGKPG